MHLRRLHLAATPISTPPPSRLSASAFDSDQRKQRKMVIEGDGESSKTKYADTLKVVERDGDGVEREVNLSSRHFIYIKAGETIDIMSILFTESRDFLIKNDGEKVRCESLKGKTIVLHVVPLDIPCYSEPWSTLDMIDAHVEVFWLKWRDTWLSMLDLPLLARFISRAFPQGIARGFIGRLTSNFSNSSI